MGAYAAVRWVIGPGSAERALAVSQAKDYNFVDGQLRLFGSFTSGGELAAWVSPVICVCAFYAVAVAGRWRALAIAACVLCTIGLLGSENRTGLVAIVLGLSVCFVVFQVARGLQSSRLTASLGLLVGVLLVGGTVFMFTIAGSPGSVDRYKGIFHPEREQSVKHRQEKWDAVLPQIDQEALGHGVGTAGRTQKREGRFINLGTNDVNSGYFRVGFEQGPWAMWFYAFALIVVLGGLIFWAATTPARLPAALATGAAGAFVAFAMLLASESAFSEGLGTLAVWMLLGTAVGAVRQAGTR